MNRIPNSGSSSLRAHTEVSAISATVRHTLCGTRPREGVVRDPVNFRSRLSYVGWAWMAGCGNTLGVRVEAVDNQDHVREVVVELGDRRNPFDNS